MLGKLIQQNEDLKTMVLAQRDSRFDHTSLLLDGFRLKVHDSRECCRTGEHANEALQSNIACSPDQQSPQHPKRDGPLVKFSDDEVEPSSQDVVSNPHKAVPSPVNSKQQQESAKWGMNIPEIDWTDEDELVS